VAYQSRARIIDMHEREARIFPREELFDSRGISLLLSETRKLNAVDLRHVADGIELKVQGLIGYLPLTADLVLNLRPKFPVKNLWAMLAVADENYDRLLPVLRSYETANVTAPHQLLARGFCYYLSQILTVGVARGYYQEPYRGHFKPKINIGQTAAKFLSRGDEVNVASDVFMFSTQLHFNGLLKSACLAFQRVLPRSDRWRNERLLLMSALNALHAVPLARMCFGDQSRASSVPIWARDAYLGALTVYAVLLGFTKVGFSYDNPGCEIPSFLFSLDCIFERYVRNTFKIVLCEQSISVLDGNISRHQSSLFLDNRRFPTKPDLIFRKDKEVLGIGEVKYKPKIGEGDRYQLISHVVAHCAPVGVWISPATDDHVGLEYIGSISTGARFYHYRLNIADDLGTTSLDMVKEVASLLV
jgi:5-methylcytosine-specific restriction enzyme subunit McrC